MIIAKRTLAEEKEEMQKKKIVVFTGVGISAESGLSTFRDSDGLWEKHPIKKVAFLYAGSTF